MEPCRRWPLYRQAHDQLIDMIRDGTFSVGQQLPSEAELSSSLRISRPTLREALRALEQAGLVARRHGVGTFVTRSEPIRSGLEKLESLVSLAAAEGLTTEVLELSAEETEADESVAERLEIPFGHPVTAVRRTVVVDGVPISWLEDFVPIAYLRAPEVDSTFNGSVLDLLRQRQNIRIEKAVADITAVQATRVMAQRLQVSLGAPLVLITETLVDAGGARVGFSFNYSVPGRLGIRVVRS